LVAQVPALIVSLAAGILVTRASEESDLGNYLTRQLTLYPRAIGILSGMMAMFAILPGMPMAPFLALAAGLAIIAVRMSRQAEEVVVAGPGMDLKDTDQGGKGPPAQAAQPEGRPKSGLSEEFRKIMDLDVLSVELGSGLLALADRRAGGDLLDRVTGVRRNYARDLGMVIPPIAIRDNIDIEANEYRFLLRGKEVARGKVLMRHWLAMNVANSAVKLRGMPTVEPVFGIAATWVDEEEKRTAEIHGFTVVDPASVLITHLSETVKRQAYLILGRQDVQVLLDTLKETNPVLVTGVVPDLLSVGVIQRVLQNLLREGISIRNLTTIMECMSDHAATVKNPDDLSEQVRRRLGTYFVAEYESEPGVVKAMTLEPRLEQILSTKVHRTQMDVGLVIDPQMAQYLLGELSRRMTEMAEQGLVPVLITTTELRLAFKRFFEPSLAKLVVLSYQELPMQTEIRNVSIILPPAPAAKA
jgi:flagellar biosynthesis protein FlhA